MTGGKGELPAQLEVADLRVIVESTGDDVIDEVSFSLRTGETLGLVGESGSGKTTVALALLAYARRGLSIVSGEVRIDGQDVLALSSDAIRRARGARVAYVPQDPASALNPGLKISRQLEEVLAREDASGDGDDRASRLTRLLEEVSLPAERILGSYPHQLSGGQQQRVVLAMGFALRPSVIVLDEPTTGLDVTTQRRVIETIREICAEHGATAVFVSHDLAVIGELVNHVAVMYGGRLVELGTNDEVFATPAHPYTRGLLRAIPSLLSSRTLVGLAGQPPRPGSRPTGCLFAPRCEFQQPRCAAAPPPMTSSNANEPDGHQVRCVRAEELPAGLGLERSLAASQPAGAPEDDSVLEISDLSAGYGAVPVLFDVNLALRAGECLAIVGESGSGKTTLARCVVGLHERWEGLISLAAEPLAHAASKRSDEQLRALQYVFQNPYGSLNPRKTVGQILEQAVARLLSIGRSERAGRIASALESTALDMSFRDRYPAELSGGERQRVAIARALAVEPKILVCDEVTSSLDVSVQAAIVEMLRRLQLELRLTLVFITHNLALVRSIAQRVVVMQAGRVVEVGSCETVLQRPADAYTRQLLSDLPALDTGLTSAADRAQPGGPTATVSRRA